MTLGFIIQYVIMTFLCCLGWFMRRRLKTSTLDVRTTQQRVLLNIVSDNLTSQYSKIAGLESVNNREDFVRQHPLTTYSHYEPFIQRMMKGECNVLTVSEPVRFAVTSGTTGKSSTLPIIKKQEGYFFFSGISIIYQSMMTAFPAAKSVKKTLKLFYNAKPRTVECGLPIGPNSSTPANTKRVLSLYTTPKAGYDIRTEPEALYIHLLFGLKDKNVGTIETNFASLVYSAFCAMDANWESLLEDIELGRVCEALNIDDSVRQALNKKMKPDSKRSDELREAKSKGSCGIAKRIWPGLNLIISADSGTFRLYSQRLQDVHCKGIPIYSAVYAATEGLIGLNIWPEERPSRYLLDPRAIFFELIHEAHCHEKQPSTIFMEQAEVGQCYELVITIPSGLYRYRFGDVVKVVGYYHTCPIVEFMYRKGQFLNVRAEKTSEATFYSAVTCATRTAGVTLVDYCCAESMIIDVFKDPERYMPCYYVFVEMESDKQVELDIDKELCNISFVYKSFRDKGSIGPMKVLQLQPGTFSELRSYILYTRDSSPTQYKTSRVVKDIAIAQFILNRVINPTIYQVTRSN